MIASQPISSGKHVLLYAGDVASVEESHTAAVAAGDGTILKEILIPGVHPELTPFLDAFWNGTPHRRPTRESIAIVESLTLAGAILAADRALKAADVSLVSMKLGDGIGGKAFFILTGRQEELEAGIEVAYLQLKDLGSLGRVDLIPRPQEEAMAFFSR
jgi:microcompartment protein CcmL/EutN